MLAQNRQLVAGILIAGGLLDRFLLHGDGALEIAVGGMRRGPGVQIGGGSTRRIVFVRHHPVHDPQRIASIAQAAEVGDGERPRHFVD